MNILITGGTGYIGSHTALELIQSGNQVIIIDNLSNSSPIVLTRLEQITGSAITFIEGDIANQGLLQQIFKQYKIDAVIHFAALKSVGESVLQPLKYYNNNVTGSLVLFEEMAKAGIFNLIFSSSATVYGTPATVPITEDMPVGQTTNPYGTSKYMIENILKDIYQADHRWRIVLLRYFNPIGAHHSGLIGECPQGIPNNILPYITQVAIGKLEKLTVFGNDYPTADGTGVRDYIHVVDLALGHSQALQVHCHDSGVHIYNLGTGTAYSVLELIHTFEQVTGQTIPYTISSRREGDIAVCYANTDKAQKYLNWTAKKNLTDMINDSWHWQSMNPQGYTL